MLLAEIRAYCPPESLGPSFDRCVIGVCCGLSFVTRLLTVVRAGFGSIVAIGVAAGSRARIDSDSTGVQRPRIISPLARGNFSG
jgi:hypothetical protein